MPGRLFRIVALSALMGLPEVCVGSELQASDSMRRPEPSPVVLTASLSSGWIEGVVTDERSRPVLGAAVTAQGRDFVLVETDGAGRFNIRGVPAGTYLVRVQGRGYTASRREFLQVVPARGTRHDVRLRRVAEGDPAPNVARVLAAGMAVSSIAPGSVPDADASPEAEKPKADDHDHSSAAWRLRHLKRPVLRDSVARAGNLGSSDDELWDDASRFDIRDWTSQLGRSTTSFLTRNAFTGRVQFLTSGAFDQPFESFDDQEMPAGIAYINVGSPLSTRTSWSVEAAAAQGSVSSWFLGGTYATVIADSHGVDVRSSFSRQRYDGGNPAALAAFADGSRNVGGVQVMDRWTLSSRALVTYGGRYEHYDYLQRAGLLSPTVTVALSPAHRTWIRATVAQQMSAPGAEEFLPQAYGSLALPPQRTFAPLVPGADFGSERTRHLSVELEREVATLLLGVEHFRQAVDDQLVTVFGLELPDGRTRSDLGHYSVANGGNFAANGWTFSVSRTIGTRIRGGIDYTIARAEWTSPGDTEALGRWAPSAIRAPQERLHDLRTHVDASVPESATRVVATYKLNSGYTQDRLDEIAPGTETRFDFQVYQGLPFLGFTRANWELVFSIRNLFRESRDGPVSVYDELLVVRPPKRVVGGVTVQF